MIVSGHSLRLIQMRTTKAAYRKKEQPIQRAVFVKSPALLDRGQIKTRTKREGKIMRPTTLDPTKMGSKAQTLEVNLRSRIVGQDEAVEPIANAYQTYLSGMTSASRPIASFLFLGPTGSGKTRTVEAVADCLLNNPRAVIKIDCAEFQHSHEISKLIGSPPGYIGHRETRPVLSQSALDEHHTDT